MKCYYHNADLDGKCSAAIVRRKYPECELIGVDYPDRPDFENIKKGECVFIVDYSFNLEDMRKLQNITVNLNWIDHHKSAIEVLRDFHCPGIRRIGKAACELTWEYLSPDEPMPNAVRYIGRYDIFDKSNLQLWNKNIEPLQYGMRAAHDWDPTDTYIWNTLFKAREGGEYHHSFHIYDLIKDGEIVRRYIDHQNKAYAKAMAFPVEFENHKAWAINKALSNSKIFETLENSDERPLWILFNYRAGVWKYSLYSAPDSGIDVSEIAVKYGGGGHAGAAGFQSDKYLLVNA
jgi:oligoribonuclease NrnB/cAMP/cGMP phosphodiesterase (DHH superfamily)